MPYFPLKKLLDKYYYADEIAETLREIGETPTNNKNEDIELLIKEWPRHGNDYYDFIEDLSASEIREICVNYGIKSKGQKKDLIKRIRKEKLLERTFPKRKIGIISVIVIVSAFASIYGAGLATVDFFDGNTFNFENSKNIQAVETNYGTINFNIQGEKESESSENLCKNDEFGISLVIPNPYWICKDYEVHLSELNRKITDDSVIGSLFIGRITGESVVISIRESSLLQDTTVSDLIDYFVEEHEKKHNVPIEKNDQVFGPYGPAKWEIEHDYDLMPSGRMSHLSILWIDEPYVFILEQSADPPDLISDEIKQEFKIILESFRKFQ